MKMARHAVLEAKSSLRGVREITEIRLGSSSVRVDGLRN